MTISTVVKQAEFVEVTDQPPSINQNYDNLFNPPALPALLKRISIEPEVNYNVSNRLYKNTILYIPGIMTTDPRPAGQMIANMRGKNVECVENSSRGFKGDIYDATVSTISARTGARIEKGAFESTTNWLDMQFQNWRDEALRGIVTPIEIYAHSEGNIILDGSMTIFKDQMLQRGHTMAEVKLFFGKIDIYRYGSPQDNTRYANSTEFEHSGDPVTKLDVFLDNKNKVLNWLKGEFRNESNVITIRNKAHGGNILKFPLEDHLIMNYLNNNPQFYDQAGGSVTPQGKAYMLVYSIQNGFFSDPEYHRIINYLAEDVSNSQIERQVFARSLIEAAPQRRIGAFQISNDSWSRLNTAARYRY